MGRRCANQVYGLGFLLAFVAAPGFTPEPLLWEGLDGYLVDHVVGQVLVEVGQTVGVLTQHLILAPKPVPRSQPTEPLQVNHIEGTNVVLAVTEMVPPVTLLPEPAEEEEEQKVTPPSLLPFLSLT